MTTIQSREMPEHEVGISFLRTIAALFVVLIHSAGMDSASAVFFQSLARFSVPAFVMISGYGMLAKQHHGSHLAKKCAALFAKMLIWAAIYYLYDLLRGQRSYAGIRSLLIYLLTEPAHLWYCYASIALYLLTPVLYVFCKNASRKEYQYTLALTFLLGSVVLLLVRSGWFPLLQMIVDKMKIPYTLGFLHLYLLGGYIRKFGLPQKKDRLVLYLLGVAGTAAAFFGTLFLSARNLQTDLFMSFFAPTSILAGAACFVFIQQTFLSLGDRVQAAQRAIRRISGCTLGIYLLHPLILMLLERILSPAPHPLLTPLRALLAFALSLLLVFIAKHIPVLKRLV